MFVTTGTLPQFATNNTTYYSTTSGSSDGLHPELGRPCGNCFLYKLVVIPHLPLPKISPARFGIHRRTAQYLRRGSKLPPFLTLNPGSNSAGYALQSKPSVVNNSNVAWSDWRHFRLTEKVFGGTRQFIINNYVTMDASVNGSLTTVAHIPKIPDTLTTVNASTRAAARFATKYRRRATRNCTSRACRLQWLGHLCIPQGVLGRAAGSVRASGVCHAYS